MPRGTEGGHDLRIDFNEDLSGLSAVDRVHRTVVIAVRHAMDHLESLGWVRDEMEISADVVAPLISTLSLKGRVVFEVGFRDSVGGDPAVVGHWLGEPSRPLWPRRRLRLKVAPDA